MAFCMCVVKHTVTTEHAKKKTISLHFSDYRNYTNAMKMDSDSCAHTHDLSIHPKHAKHQHGMHASEFFKKKNNLCVIFPQMRAVAEILKKKH